MIEQIHLFAARERFSVSEIPKAGVGKTCVRYDKGCREYRHPFCVVLGID